METSRPIAICRMRRTDRATGGDVCGVMSNTNFGKNVLSNNFDARLLNGWGVRPSDWNLGVTIQQQIGPRSSVDVTYSRRWFRGFSVVDNLALQPSDLTPFDIVAPLDPRLPGGGGYVVSGLYDVVPAKAGQVNNLVVDSMPYGKWYPWLQWPRRHDQCPRRPESHGDGRTSTGRRSPTTATSVGTCQSSRRPLPRRAGSAPV